jgi:hypothetical protein
MSSPGFAMTVELPRWSLADRVTVALVVAAGIVIEAVAAGRDGVPSGAGLAAAAVLLVWHARHRAGRPLSLELQPAGNGASRILGPTIVLHWQSAAGGRQGLWLTPLDLPRRTLRQLAVRLVTGRAVAP